MGPATIHFSTYIFKKEKYVDILGKVESELIMISATEIIILTPLVQDGHVVTY